MGNHDKGDKTPSKKREKGTVKKKSIKAKVTSSMSAKRKLSRHGKTQRKGMEGSSTEYVTRSQALRKLQITLKDFRRLCILKGIYPRVPLGKAPKGSDKVYYDIKDLSHLNHEPLLQKFRDFKAFMKKIRKASGRNEYEDARRRDELKPVMNLNHLVKERYPRFIDALRDMDDALCMIHLFAAMPSAGRITASHTLACGELARHWQYYVAKSNSLNKVFVSVKGVYFQATVLGESVNWLVPHQFTQQVPKEVDLRVMLTFLDFYEVFVRFSLYKLYMMVGLQYPPQIDKSLDEAGACLLAIKPANIDASEDSSGNSGSGNVIAAALENQKSDENQDDEINDQVEMSAGEKKKAKSAKSKADAVLQGRIGTLGAKLDALAEDDEDDELEDDEQIPVQALTEAFNGFESKEDYLGEEEKSVFTMPDTEGSKRLFSGLRFFCNREVPLDWLQICILSLGGQVGWAGETSPYSESDSSITHHVVDRPMPEKSIKKGREYVQPQWLFDSINAQIRLPVSKYQPGSQLPPHLSPFVDDNEGYVPKYREEIQKLQAAAGLGGVQGKISTSKVAKEELGDGDEDEDDDFDEQDEENAAQIRSKNGGNSDKASVSKRSRDYKEDEEESNDGGEFDEESSEPESEVEDVVLETNTKRSKGSKGIVYESNDKKMTEDDEAKELAKSMMSKKTSRLYGRMMHGIKGKSDEVENLEQKRIALEKKEGEAQTDIGTKSTKRASTKKKQKK